MSDSLIMSNKRTHASYVIYKRFVYHLRIALLLILHKKVRSPPNNVQILAQTTKQEGTFGYKPWWAILRLCLPYGCKHHMRCMKDICIIQEWPWYWYTTNKSIYCHITPRFLLRNKNREVRMAFIIDEWHFNYVYQVFAHIIWDILKIFVSFRNSHGTDTPQTSPFTTLECPNSCSDFKKGTYVWL